jgi:hypothetical protein
MKELCIVKLMWGGNSSAYQLLVMSQKLSLNSFMHFAVMKLEGLTLPTLKLIFVANYGIISQIQNFVYQGDPFNDFSSLSFLVFHAMAYEKFFLYHLCSF